MKTALMERYEKETGLPAIDPHEWECYGHEGEKFHSYEFTAWLAKQLTPITVAERLPESGQIVLANYNDKTVRAEYVHRFTLECNDFDCDNYEYNEEKDEFYIIEGWYELIDNWGDFKSIAIVEGTVDSWLPMPTM
jgi:hypothetical protein